MNARPEQFQNPRKSGLLSRFATFCAIHLVGLIDWREVPMEDAHLGGAKGVSFGTHTIRIGDSILFNSSATPAVAGEFGADTTTGRLKAYIGGASRDVPGSHEVLALSGGSMSGNIAMGTNKITGMGAGSTGTTDGCNVTQMESYVNNRIATRVDAGYDGGAGFLGHGSITEINALSPVIGDIVVAENSGTPSAGTSDALGAGDVAEFDGTSWQLIIAASGGFVPSGTRLIVGSGTFISAGGLTDGSDEGKIATFDGTSLSPSSFSSPVDGTVVSIARDGALYENKILMFDGAVPTGLWQVAGGVATSHSALTNLTSGDDHTQYAKIGGRSGGQTLKGGTGSGEDLNLQSTNNATKGSVKIANGDTLRMMGNDSFIPNTTGQGKVGTSSNKFAEVNALVVNTGDLRMRNPDGDPEKAWCLRETRTGLDAENLGNGEVRSVIFVRKGSPAERLLHLLG